MELAGDLGAHGQISTHTVGSACVFFSSLFPLPFLRGTILEQGLGKGKETK